MLQEALGIGNGVIMQLATSAKALSSSAHHSPAFTAPPRASSPSAPISVLLVDDSASFLQSALRFLSADSAIDVIGLARNGLEALRQVEALHPDLVLMDWAMPEMSGLEATRQLKAGEHAPHVIILTLHDSDEYRDAAQQAHADGFMAKADFGLKLMALINQILPAPIVSPLPEETPVPFSTAPVASAVSSIVTVSSSRPQLHSALT